MMGDLTSYKKTASSALEICVGVLTRDRPVMARKLLASLQKLEVPDNSRVSVVLIENGGSRDLARLTTEFSPCGAISALHYMNEAQPGVVISRNRALEFALNGNFDRLAFIDDDEVADPCWLKNLSQEMSRTGAELAGGPVRPFVRIAPDQIWKKIIWKGYQARCRHVEGRANLYHQLGFYGRTMLATNNWLVDTAFCRRHALRFDPQFNLTGGEDSDFFRRAVLLQAKTSWVPSAIVYEEIPSERLSFVYQFERSHDQSLVSYHRKYGKHTILKYLLTPVSAVFSAAQGLLLLLLAPLTLGHTLYRAARKFGAASGRISGLFGSRTEHYAKVTGY